MYYMRLIIFCPSYKNKIIIISVHQKKVRFLFQNNIFCIKTMKPIVRMFICNFLTILIVRKSIMYIYNVKKKKKVMKILSEVDFGVL